MGFVSEYSELPIFLILPKQVVFDPLIVLSYYLGNLLTSSNDKTSKAPYMYPSFMSSLLNTL